MKAADAATVSMSWAVLRQIRSYCPNGMLPPIWYAVGFMVFCFKYRIKTCAPGHCKFPLNLQLGPISLCFHWLLF